MRKINGLLLLMMGFNTYCQQTDSSVVATNKQPDYIWIFSSPKLINANTVEMLPKGILEFKITHNFGDIAGDEGGIDNFFGLDEVQDVRIGFQYGLSKRLNLIAARAKGADQFPDFIEVRQLYELGIKYRLMQQANDPKHPISLVLFGNVVVSGMKAYASGAPPGQSDDGFNNFSDRLSQTLQLMIARKFGKLSLQLSPTVVNRNYVMDGDLNTIFALGGGLRLPIMGRFSIIADYFHPFRSQSNIEFFKDTLQGGKGAEPNGVHFYDPFGIGIEVLTEGHVFHLNFTNATEILENRFIPRTTKAWSKGQFRWGFTISRDFDLFWKKKNKQK